MVRLAWIFKVFSLAFKTSREFLVKSALLSFAPYIGLNGVGEVSVVYRKPIMKSLKSRGLWPIKILHTIFVIYFCEGFAVCEVGIHSVLVIKKTIYFLEEFFGKLA